MDSIPRSWTESVQGYLRLYAALHLAPSSRRRMSIILDQFGSHLSGMPEVLYLSDITRNHIETYQLVRKESGKSPSTVNADVRHLRAFFRRVKLDGLIADDPTTGVKLLKVPKRRKAVRSGSEVELILRAFKTLNQPAWMWFALLIVNAGLRLGEGLALRVDDLDMAAGKLRVRVDDGFMAKDREERTVPLNRAALTALRRRLLIVGAKAGTLLWPSKAGTPIDPANARLALRKAVALAGVPHTTWQSLRRTFASVTAGRIPEQALLSICGWSDARTAKQFYIDREIMNLPPPPIVADL